MSAARRIGWFAAGAAAFALAAGLVVVGLVIFPYLFGDAKPYDGTCIGGSSAWAWTELVVAVAAVPPAVLCMVQALRGRPSPRALGCSLSLATLWIAILLLLPESSPPVC